MHAPEHDEFTLGKIQHAGRTVDQIETDRHDRVYAALGDAREQVLQG